MTILLPHTFHDGSAETASGAQLMENLTTLKQASEPGAWLALALGAKVQAKAGTQSLAARLEKNGALVRLRGALEANAELGAADVLLTLPVGYRPANTLRITYIKSGAVFATLLIATNGEVTQSLAAQPIGTAYPFDGITFNLR